MRRMAFLAALALVAIPAPAAGQAYGVAARIGTTGIGIESTLGGGRFVSVRAGGFVIPIEPRWTSDELEFSVQPPSPLFTAALDLHPFGNAVRIAGGLLFGAREMTLVGAYSGTVTIGDQDYDGEAIGTLHGVITTRSAAPFFGLGFGRPAGRGFGVLVDLGVALLGDPRLALSASGPIAGDAQFRSDLERERARIEEDYARYGRFYPMLSVGFRFGL